eukprot:Nk52_evm1s2475 gene=Nk52_evmTU1s2475
MHRFITKASPFLRYAAGGSALAGIAASSFYLGTEYTPVACDAGAGPKEAEEARPGCAKGPRMLHLHSVPASEPWNKNWDAMQEVNKDYKGPVKFRHILLVRHGQYNHDSEENELTELGRKQADILAKRLVEIDATHHIQSITHSGVCRARETAEIVSKRFPHLKLKEDPMLAEGYPCQVIPERAGFDEPSVFRESIRIEAAFREHIHRPDCSDIGAPKKEDTEKEIADKKSWLFATGKPAPGGGGGGGGGGKGGGSDFLKPSKHHEYEVIVCHGNVIRYFLMRAMQLTPEAWLRMSPMNCSITEVIITSGGAVSVRGMGDTGFLPVDMITFN